MSARLSRWPLLAVLPALVPPVPGHREGREQAGSQASKITVQPTTSHPMPTLAPGLRLVAIPATPSAGRRFELIVRHAPPGARDYRWDLDGRGYSVSTGSAPRTKLVFPAAGFHKVAVRVAERGTTRTASEAIEVLPSAGVRRPGGHERRPTRNALGHPHANVRQLRQTRLSSGPSRATGDPGVTIADFQFTPGTTTVHAGDTITWTNNGPSEHSATANDGSFDTGVLQKGASASHSFTQAGTFTYFCKIHPFMHGTIVVLAAATSTTTSTTTTTARATNASATGGANGATGGGAQGTSGQPSSASTPAPASATSSAQSLPRTGFNLILSISLALCLVGAGLALRSAADRRE